MYTSDSAHFHIIKPNTFLQNKCPHAFNIAETGHLCNFKDLKWKIASGNAAYKKLVIFLKEWWKGDHKTLDISFQISLSKDSHELGPFRHKL